MENIEVVPDYNMRTITYFSNDSNYQMRLSTNGEKILMVLGFKRMKVNNLVFDSKQLTDSLIFENTYVFL